MREFDLTLVAVMVVYVERVTIRFSRNLSWVCQWLLFGGLVSCEL